MNTLLQGKTILVTGGTNGIGRAIAATAARHGASAVIVMDQTAEPRDGTAVEQLVRDAGARFYFHCGTVTDAQSLAAGVALADAHGGLDVMVANAGIASADDHMDIDEAQYERIIDVNIKGVFRSARAAARAMIARARGGSIILMASMGGVKGAPETLTYSATKGAVRLYAQSFAATLGPHNIRVNAICPGVIDTSLAPPSAAFNEHLRELTQRTPLRRRGRPEEVADAAVWLGSDMSSFVNGTSLLVDGGLTAVL